MTTPSRKSWAHGVAILAARIREEPSRFDSDELELLDLVLRQLDPVDLRATIGRLASKLELLRETLSEEDRRCVTELFSVVGGTLLEAREQGRILAGERASRLVVERLVSPGAPDCRHSGRPAFIDDELLSALQEEARALRSSADRRNQAWVAPVGHCCSTLMRSAPMLSLIRATGLQLRGSDAGTTIFYEGKSDGCRAHIDIGEFMWNALLCIDVWPKGFRSALQLHHGDEIHRMETLPGDLILFDAGRTFHGRPALGEDAGVTIATFGFTEISEEPR